MTAEEFWDWFVAEQGELLRAGGQAVADAIEARLRQVDARIGVEVSEPDVEPREVVFTAWSQAEAFAAVRALMAAAPRERLAAGWVLFALKPPRGFQFGIDVDGLKVDASQLKFDPLASPQAPTALGIRIYVSAAPPSDPRWPQALSLILETGIGEQAAAQIDYIEAAAAPPPPDEKAVGIEQLLSYVQWHRKKHGLE